MTSTAAPVTEGIRESIEGIPFVLNTAGRRFIQEGSLERLLNRSVKCSYYIYLFSDVIVYAQRRKKPPHKYITHKYLANCLFVDYADSSKGLRYAFEIKNLDEKKFFEESKGLPQEKEEFVFLAKSLDQKNGWKRDIERQINFAAEQERCIIDEGSASAAAFGAYVSGFSEQESGNVSDDGVSTSANTSPPEGALTNIPEQNSPSSSSMSSTPTENWSHSSYADGATPEDEEASFEELEELQSSGEGAIMGQDENGSIIVRAASISFIAWFLVCGDHTDTSLIQSFLFTYRAFNTPLELLEILKDIYVRNLPPHELPIKYSAYDTRRKVASFLRIWILKFFAEDFDGKVMYSRALDFIYEIGRNHLHDANLLKVALLRVNKERIAKKVERRKRSNPIMAHHSRNPSESLANHKATSPSTGLYPLLSPGSSASWGNKFIEFNLSAVADYLAYSEHALFQQVALSEFAKMAWMNPKYSKKLSPNVLMSTYKFNQLSQWVSTEIVLTGTPKQRAVMIERFVSLASKCVELRNFHTLMEILAGINRGFVDRLKKSWNLVSHSAMETLQELNDLMDPKQNFKNYREAVRKASSPCLPYFGIFLRDIVFAEEGNPDKTEELINFEKIQIIGKIYKDVLHYQKGKYPTCEDDVICNYFKNLWVMPDEVLYQHSRAHEPSANSRPVDDST